MHVRAFARTLAAALMIAFAGTAHAGGKPVVELFTSQGCSSCPAADALLGKLAANPDVIPLTLAVDYWDYLGWRDTLALSAHTLRQKNYARTRGDMNVYTPQAIVNGVKYAVGSDQGGLEAAIKRAAESGGTVPLKLSRNTNNVSVEVGAGSGNGTVWLLTITNKVQVQISRGENRGATVTYTNVVRSWRKLGGFSGAPEKYTVPLAELTANQADAVVVFVQSGAEDRPGEIKNAELLSLK